MLLSGHVQDKMAPYDDDTYIIHGITRMHPYYSPYANDEEGKHYGLTNFQNPCTFRCRCFCHRKERMKLFNGVFSLKLAICRLFQDCQAKVLFSYLTKVEEFKTRERVQTLFIR